MTGPDHEPPLPPPRSPVAGDGAPPLAGPPLARRPWQRALLLVAGWVALALGVLGIFLPLLPTTPLVLLAAFCFARVSERAHNWLLRHRVFGPIVDEWRRNRCIPRRAKWIAIVLVIAAFTISLLVVPNSIYAHVTLLVVGAALVIFLATLPTSPSARRPDATP